MNKPIVWPLANYRPDIARASVLRAMNEAQNCANILWSLARRGRHTDHEDISQAIAERASMLDDWDEQSLSTCVWALAILGQRMSSLPLLKAVSSDLDELRQFSLESLCVFAWTCGLLGLSEHPTHILAIALRERSNDLTSSHLVSVPLAFARIWPKFQKNKNIIKNV